MNGYAVVILSKTLSKLEACLCAIRGAGCDAPIIVAWDEAASLAPHSLGERFVDFAPLHVFLGEQPFVFARNANRGIRSAGAYVTPNVTGSPAVSSLDVILINDDAQLTTPNGFNRLSEAAQDPNGRQFGVVSALILGGAAADDQMMGRPHSRNVLPGRIRECTHHMLAFVCVYIRRTVIDYVGLLDQRFTAYGYDDDDYCARVRLAGWKLGVFDPCIVEHGSIESTYRGAGSASVTTLDANRAVFVRKWGMEPRELAEAQEGRWSIR